MTIEKFNVKDNTIKQLGTCKSCGWPVIFACCNDGFGKNLKDGDCADWWTYCTNKGCDHHVGEDAGQGTKYRLWVDMAILDGNWTGHTNHHNKSKEFICTKCNSDRNVMLKSEWCERRKICGPQ